MKASLGCGPSSFRRKARRTTTRGKARASPARKGIDNWVKVVWVKRSYHTREAEEGYAPDPDFSKLPPYNELITQAFGEYGIIRDTSHKMYRALMGKKPTEAGRDDEDLI